MQKNKDTEVQEYLDHFDPELSADILKYVRDEVFLYSRYIFTRRQGKRRYGYCTHCNQEFPIPRTLAPEPSYRDEDFRVKIALEHKHKKPPQAMRCPSCGSVCVIKASGRGRKHMFDEAYMVYYEKSLKNPEAIVARGIRVTRDYRCDYKNIETRYHPEALYVFEKGRSTMLKLEFLYHEEDPKAENGYQVIWGWRKRKTVFTLFKDQWNPDTAGYQLYPGNLVLPCFVSEDSIEKAVQGTPFQYSTWEEYPHNDRVQFFDLYNKYPCIEYLTKMGFDNLVREKINGYATYRTVNWKGKSPLQVLKLSKQEIKEIRANKINLSFSLLAFIRNCKKNGLDLSLAEMAAIHQDCLTLGSYYEEIFQSFLEYTTMRKAHNYLKKQARNERIKGFDSALIAWRDYRGDCIKLGLDLASEATLFPRDLYTAHQNTTQQVKHKTDKELNKVLAKKVKRLTKEYYFEYKGFLIRPAKSTNELIKEGKALQHCVGTYADRYARGEDILLVIRKKSAPDKPYFTVEIRHDAVIQCRGLRNCAPDAKVEKFMEAFKAAKLQKKKSNKTKITVPA